MRKFVFGNEDEVINHPDNIPTTAFVIVESKNGYMLLYNKYRNKCFSNYEIIIEKLGSQTYTNPACQGLFLYKYFVAK